MALKYPPVIHKGLFKIYAVFHTLQCFFYNNALCVCVQYGLLCSGDARAEQTVFSGQSVGSGRFNCVHAGCPPPLLLEDRPTE